RPGGPMEKAKEDRTSLVVHLTAKDAEAFKQLTSAHLGTRLLMLLNDDPLFAPLLRTPSTGESVYITPPARFEYSKAESKARNSCSEAQIDRVAVGATTCFW